MYGGETHWLPIVQEGQVDLPVVVYEHVDIDAHVGSGLNVAQGSILRVSVHQPNADGNVVGVIWKGITDGGVNHTD